MRRKYESPDIEIIKFSLNTSVLAVSNTGEGEVGEASTFFTEPSEDFDPWA